jgi:hypothetical protein
MTYAIVQKELVVPELERLKRAFAVWPALTGIDAQTSANDAFGILLRGLEIEQASLLQDALLKENIDTVVVEEAKLPSLPPGRIGRQAELDENHLTLYDSMRRPSQLAWNDIICISAGLVKSREGYGHSTGSGTRPKDDLQLHLILEIFLRAGAGRFSIAGEDFSFDHLGAQVSEDVSLNFVAFVQELVQHAPHAGLNRGAYAACQRPPELFPYPSKQAFNEELTWMLWRIEQI